MTSYEAKPSQAKPSQARSIGFTLIELSIVLVIIGLIIGGVLVGRDLIEASNIRAQIKQFENYKLALNSFRLKYNCLPGDCASASGFGLGNNGNGNGVLELNDISSCYWILDNSYTTPDCGWNGEFPLFFQHLSASQMIEGNYTGVWGLGVGFPKVSINQSTGIMAAGAWHEGGGGTTPNLLRENYSFPSGFWLHAMICRPTVDVSNLDRSNTNDYCGVFTPAQMQQMDTKIDDGKPLSGRFWSYTGYWPTKPAFCLNGDFTSYNTSSNYVVCHASYKMD